MIKKGNELKKLLKGKRVVIVAGELCNEIDFDGKKILDYAVEISNKLGAPIAAAGNTAIPLRENGAKSVTKLWAIELMNFIRWPWEKEQEHPLIMDEKPEVLLFIGYSAAMAQSLVSTAKRDDCATVVLGSKYVEGASYSFPDSSSFKQWEQNLKEFVESLEGK
jgi:CO dehydrogenase/acetyl-CoA synthase epsilon subunit